MAKKCFLCESSDGVMDFNENTFKNCLLKLAFRKERNFKYNDVILTNDARNVVGYHSSCYKKVTVLKKNYNDDFNNFVSNENVPQVSSGHQSDLASKEANEKTIQQKLLVSLSTLNSSSSTRNNYSARSRSRGTSQQKLSHSPLTHKSLKHDSLCTKRIVRRKKPHDDDTVSKTLQRLERISNDLNTTQQQLTSQTQDEFYFFALSVAAQLRNLPVSIAIEIQRNIQNTLSAARLSTISNTASPSSSNNCNSPICDQSSNSVDQDTANTEPVSYIKIEESFHPDFLEQS